MHARRACKLYTYKSVCMQPDVYIVTYVPLEIFSLYAASPANTIQEYTDIETKFRNDTKDRTKQWSHNKIMEYKLTIFSEAYHLQLK